MYNQGIQEYIICTYKTEMSVRLSVCPSRFGGVLPRETGKVYRKEGGNWEGDFHAEGDGEGGQEGGGQWGGGISMMECQGGHTFPSNARSPSQ